MARIYVSSTILDMEAERKAVLDWIRGARHQAVDSYLPDSDTVRESCLDDIDACDLYVLILGHRYGFQPQEDNPEKLSITHLEFRRAGESGIPRIALLRTSIPDTSLSDIENPEKAPLLFAFRAEVQREVRPAEFCDLQGLITGLSTGVPSALEKLRAPLERERAERWLAAHLQETARQFADHMAASALISGTRPEDLFLDLLVARRHLGREKEAASGNEKTESEAHPLEDVLQRAEAPLLLIGEGGAGKTTSLLYLAARAADRAAADPAALVPIYVNLARLTELSDVPDLLQLIADSVPLVRDWDELSGLGIVGRRRVLFLFDSFNEIPEQLQRTAAVVLSRFVEKHRSDHGFLVGSRLVPHVEQLARPPSQFHTFEILRLTPDQVQGFLESLGLGSLYERMPRELRDLAGNPFMLSAIARTLAGKPEGALPRNRGKLYQSFAREWMEREGKKQRGLSYSYDRVKEPLLAFLANLMTSAAQTSLVWTDELENAVEARLEAIHQRVRRRGGMPDDWTVDRCLDEVLDDGLLKRVDRQLHFVHQSVQEYFTAVHFRDADPDALVDFTPKLAWELVSTYALAEVPNHRFVSALLMMAGLLDDGTGIIQALADRNPVLAAAVVASASRVDGSLLAALEQRWLDLLGHEDERHRIVGCSCLVLAGMRSPRVVRRLVEFALGSDFNDSYVGVPALARLGVPDAVALQLVERARELDEDEYEKRGYATGQAVKALQSARLVGLLFEEWRASPPGSPARERFEALLAMVDPTICTEELQRIRSAAPDPETAADAGRALAEGASWEGLGLVSARTLRQIMAKAQKEHADQVAGIAAALKGGDDRELADGLRSDDRAVRLAAATVAAERRAPVGDVLLEAIVRFDDNRNVDELVAALVSLWGEGTAAARLAEAARERCRCLGSLDPDLADQLGPGEPSEGVKAEIERLGVREKLSIEERESDGNTSIWTLLPSSWGSFRPRYQLRASPARLELYDCNVAARAFSALAKIPGDASLAELRRAVEHDDANVRRIALSALAERGEPGLAATLLAQLKSATSREFVHMALGTLRELRDRRSLSLLDDLLATSEGEWSDVHPGWGPSLRKPGWGDDIHAILLKLDADGDVQRTLDRALASERPGARVAALKEFTRWFEEREVDRDRAATWRTPARLQLVLRMALSDPDGDVRAAAAQALRAAKSETVQSSLAEALSDPAAEVRVAAGDALARMNAQELYGRVVEAMLEVVRSHPSQELRRRAGNVLSAVPDGVEPLHRPIQAELVRGEAERALQLIASTLEILPEDVDLFWWRGHALRSLGRLAEAADSYQRACELEGGVSVIPQALAQTFLELGDYPRAMEAARQGAKIAPADADALAILAWSSYRAGAMREAVEAAARAVELDPVHGDAIWIVLLGHLRQANAEEARRALRHALRVRQLLSPGMDTSFVANVLEELAGIDTADPVISRLVEEIGDALATEDSGAG